MLNHGDRVHVYDCHGKILGRGTVWGRNVFQSEFPQYMVMPYDGKGLKDVYGYPAHQWIPAGRVRKAYVPQPEVKPVMVREDA